jgi:hypothetical protein
VAWLAHVPTPTSLTGLAFIRYPDRDGDVMFGDGPSHTGTGNQPPYWAGQPAWVTDVPVRFVASRDEMVAADPGGCQQVRDGGVLITLAPPAGTATRAQGGINGSVACEGATWLTYVIDRHTEGWAISGTTGPQAVS